MVAMQMDLREIQIIGRRTREWIVHQRDCRALAALGIQYVGVTHAAADFSFCRLNPRIAVIFGIYEGSGRVWTAGRWQPCGANGIYLAPVGTPHAYHALKGRDWRLAWVAYEERRGRSILRESQARVGKGSAITLRDVVMGLYREAHGLGEASALHHWAELVDLSARRLAHERQIDERLTELWDGIDADLGHPWNLAALAARAHVGAEHLRFLCQRDFGRSPMEHLTWLRMKRAAAQFERTNRKVSDVAEELGYQNAFAFSTAFKRVMGVSPQAFSQRITASGARVSKKNLRSR
jgi:AraC-like DNA-binding protein